MDKIKLHDKTFRPYIPYEEIRPDIVRIADKMNRDFAGTGEIPVMVCVLNGAMIFTAELFTMLHFPCELGAIKLSSYMGTQSTGVVEIKSPISFNVKDRTVIIVEDIVETGYTIEKLKDSLMELGAKEVRVCTMFFKPAAYKFFDSIPIDYVAREIGNPFIVGFGLDYDELGRNLKDIYILDE